MNLSKSTFISLLIHSEMKGSYSIKYVLPEFEVPIGQHNPVSPSQPLKSPFSKPIFGQVCANAKDDMSNMRRLSLFT